MSTPRSESRVRREYEVMAIAASRQSRCIVLFWARQCRKSTTLGAIAFDQMSREAGRHVIAASASLLVGSELVSKTLSAAEQAVLITREAESLRAGMADGAAAAGDTFSLKVANSSTGKVYQRLNAEDFADLYRTSRLEMRLYHSESRYSRLQVIAPNPATARGWSGTVLRDEAGFTRPGLETELRVAVKPIIDTDPTFRLVYASNLPRDDRHPFFEMTLPQPDAIFPPTAQGHFYRGPDGTLIHRVALADAYAAGHVLYDSQTGQPLTYDGFCAQPGNKLGLNDSYRLVHEFGGTAAIDLAAITTAQRAGLGECHFAWVENQGDFLRAVAALRAVLRDGRVAIGYDVATTTAETSNPSAVTVTEQTGDRRLQRLVCCWKERDPAVAIERVGAIAAAVRQRPHGGPAIRLSIDATSEQYFARHVADALASAVPVELVDARNLVEPAPPGYARTPSHKTFLGDLYSAAVNENRYAMPSATYLKEDHRLVVKVAGAYQCDPQPDGSHGDTFDSGKLAEWGLARRPGAITDASVLRFGTQVHHSFTPRRLPPSRRAR
jgi:hypothetical protein